MTSSSRKSGDQILGMITRHRAERLLVAWVNLSFRRLPTDGPEDASNRAIKRMTSGWPEMFRDFDRTDHHGKLELLGMLVEVNHTLVSVWNAPDLRHREWYLFKLRDAYRIGVVRAQTGYYRPERTLQISDIMEIGEKLDPPPPITPFEAAVFYLQQISDRTIRCGNPNCPAPYFIAAKKSQRYCSEACSGPALREAKRRWWNENRAKNGGIQ
jgi:hypothetical protein